MEISASTAPEREMVEQAAMERGIALAAEVRRQVAPNPWVGCVILDASGQPVGEGATAPIGGPHAEATALAAAGSASRGGTAVVTLEPCNHHGRTPPCVGALVEAGISRVVMAIVDPDPRVSGAGQAALESAGVEVEVGLEAATVERQLRAYLFHRRNGRPYVILKLAATVDGRIAASDGSSQWITGEAARRDVHRLRAESDAVLVGAATVRADDPRLTVRGVEGSDPLRVVLGKAPPDAAVHPATELSGTPAQVLDSLSEKGVLQVLIEGGASVAGQFHSAGLVDRYVVYLAPAFAGGGGGVPMMSGDGPDSMDDVWRGRFDSIETLGDDVRLELVPLREDPS